MDPFATSAPPTVWWGAGADPATLVSSPTAGDDSASVRSTHRVKIAVLANDSDPGGGTLVVGKINGTAVSVGDVVTLASGATVTVKGDGTLKYDPNGAFDALGKGEQAHDSFTYKAFQAGTAPSDLSALDGVNGFKISGVAPGDSSGWSVASAGDVNGDGFDDLIIGAVDADPHGADSGASYVVFGKTSGFAANLELSSLDGVNGFKLSGVASADNSGISVASAGDVNGDGFDDLIIGAYGADQNRGAPGASYLMFGKASGFAANLDLSGLNGVNGFKIGGVAPGDFAGWSVASAGDVNGDGFDDVIVGAPSAGPSGGLSGASYVVFGKASGFAANLDLSSLDGVNGFTINGVAASDRSGWSVASVGDINGDGFDDLVIGAPNADPNGDYSGASYVVFGKPSGFASNLDLSSLNGVNGFKLSGVAQGDDSGWSVASAGDFNGDGFDDLIVGGPNAPNGDRFGASYVVFGKASGFAANFELSSLTGVNGFRLSGVAQGDESGLCVASAGDVNGDGFDDLIVGAHTQGVQSGASYVVFGKASGFAANLDLSSLNGINGFKVSFVAGWNFTSRSMASAGDINSDGFDDLIIGAPGADSNGYLSGATYVIFGSADIGARYSNAATVDITITGRKAPVSAATDAATPGAAGWDAFVYSAPAGGQSPNSHPAIDPSAPDPDPVAAMVREQAFHPAFGFPDQWILASHMDGLMDFQPLTADAHVAPADWLL